MFIQCHTVSPTPVLQCCWLLSIGHALKANQLHLGSQWHCRFRLGYVGCSVFVLGTSHDLSITASIYTIWLSIETEPIVVMVLCNYEPSEVPWSTYHLHLKDQDKKWWNSATMHHLWMDRKGKCWSLIFQETEPWCQKARGNELFSSSRGKR